MKKKMVMMMMMKSYSEDIGGDVGEEDYGTDDDAVD